jgi:hypothetical protein
MSNISISVTEDILDLGIGNVHLFLNWAGGNALLRELRRELDGESFEELTHAFDSGDDRNTYFVDVLHVQRDGNTVEFEFGNSHDDLVQDAIDRQEVGNLSHDELAEIQSNRNTLEHMEQLWKRLTPLLTKKSEEEQARVSQELDIILQNLLEISRDYGEHEFFERAVEESRDASPAEKLSIVRRVLRYSLTIARSDAESIEELIDRGEQELPLNDLQYSLRFSLSTDDARELLSKLKDLT